MHLHLTGAICKLSYKSYRACFCIFTVRFQHPVKVLRQHEALHALRVMQVLPSSMLLLAEPSPRALIQCLHQAVLRLPSCNPHQQHLQVDTLTCRSHAG